MLGGADTDADDAAGELDDALTVELGAALLSAGPAVAHPASPTAATT